MLKKIIGKLNFGSCKTKIIGVVNKSEKTKQTDVKK